MLSHDDKVTFTEIPNNPYFAHEGKIYFLGRSESWYIWYIYDFCAVYCSVLYNIDMMGPDFSLNESSEHFGSLDFPIKQGSI